MSKASIFHTIFGVFGNATGLFLFLSPMVTFKRIIAKRSTEQFSGIPYVMTLLNCLLSTWYGLPFISPNNYLMSVVNGVGAGLEVLYVAVFLVFAPNRERAKISGLLALILALFGIIAFLSASVFRTDKKMKQSICGYAAMIFSILMYASPLSVMRMVIKTKSVAYMPFLLSLFVFLCGTSWFIYGLLGMDKFVYINNGLGSFFGAMQLIIYFIYRDNKKRDDDDVKKFITDGALEMGLTKPNQHKQEPN